MIDEKSLLKNFLSADGIEFKMNFKTESEEAIIESLQEFADKLREGVLNLIKSQPKINEWIPVSERLPNKDEYFKNDGRFIVTDGNRVYQSLYDPYSAHCFRTLVVYEYGSRANYEIDNCVIAWMPLPEPYKE